MADEPNGEKLVSDGEPQVIAPEAPANPPETIPAEGAAGGEQAPPAPQGLAAPEPGGFAERLRNAWKGFLRGWQGLPVEVPPGEEGTIPLVEALNVQRRLEKKLEKARAAAEELRGEAAAQKQRLAERDAELKESQRELKKTRAAAEEAEKALQRDLEKLQQTLREREATLAARETELEERQRTLVERGAALDALRSELREAREGAARQNEAAARELSQARGEAAQREEALRRDADSTASQLRITLAAREDAVADLTRRMAESDAANAATIAALKKELDTTREALAQKEAASQMLLNEVAEAEKKADEAHEDATRREEELRAELQRLEGEVQSANEAKEKLRGELVAALPDKVAADDLRLKIGQKEKELARKTEEADLLRDDVHTLRRRVAEFEAKLSGAEKAGEGQAGLERELQRQGAQLDALRAQLEEARGHVEKLGAVLREFHGPAVSAVQVAGVYAETVAGSLALSESDRSDIVEIKQNLETLRGALQKLAARMAEAGIR
jgi:chromosome segregation ATPase